MRVLHVTRDFPPRSAGGVSTAVGALVRDGVARGEAHAVVSFDGWRPRGGGPARWATDTAAIAGATAPVLRVAAGAPAAAIAELAAELAPDEVWCHDGLVAAHAPPHGVRVQVVHVLPQLQDRLRGAPPTASTQALATAIQAAQRVIVTTRAARDLLLAEPLGDDADQLAARLAIVPLAPTLPVVPRAPDAARAGPIAVVGRFDALKGTDLVAQALPALAALRPVVLAGGVPENPKAERWWARRLAGAEHVGWLGPDALADLYARAAVVVAPSRLETCGLALVEAAHAGAPTVASDLPAHREVAPASRFFASGDAAALVDAVRLVIAGGSP